MKQSAEGVSEKRGDAAELKMHKKRRCHQTITQLEMLPVMHQGTSRTILSLMSLPYHTMCHTMCHKDHQCPPPNHSPPVPLHPDQQHHYIVTGSRMSEANYSYATCLCSRFVSEKKPMYYFTKDLNATMNISWEVVLMPKSH